MILKATCEIKKNVKVDNYTAVEGINILELFDGDEIVDTFTSQVLWCGSGSPFPTPPGGPWATKYMKDHSRFGKCFFVYSDMESEIFIHFAAKKSYGCFIINPSERGKEFMANLIENRDGLKVIHNDVIDSRTQLAKDANPIDYDKIGKVR